MPKYSITIDLEIDGKTNELDIKLTLNQLGLSTEKEKVRREYESLSDALRESEGKGVFKNSHTGVYYFYE